MLVGQTLLEAAKMGALYKADKIGWRSLTLLRAGTDLQQGVPC